MEKLRGVVIEKSDSSCIVLSNDGSFRRIRAKGDLKVGQEIDIPTGWQSHSLRMVAGIAALFLMVLTAAFGWNLWQASVAVAVVSLDINPSIEITLNSRNDVLKAQAFNPEAVALLQQVATKSKPVQEVLTGIVSEAVRMKYLTPEHSWVVIGVSPVQGQAVPAGLDTDRVVNLVSAGSEAQGITPQVAVFQTTAAERAQARAQGLSSGEYALWRNAQQAGINIPAGAVTQSAGRNSLLNNPVVQQQIKAGHSAPKAGDTPSVPPGKLSESEDKKSQDGVPGRPDRQEPPEDGNKGQHGIPPVQGEKQDRNKSGDEDASGHGKSNPVFRPFPGDKSSGGGEYKQNSGIGKKGNDDKERDSEDKDKHSGPKSMFEVRDARFD